VCSGDFTFKGEPRELISFNSFIHDLKEAKTIKKCVVTYGNHEVMTEKDPWGMAKLYLPACELLHRSDDEIEGIKFYGLPDQLPFFNWAYNSSEEKIAGFLKWVPDDVDVVVSHGPPYGILDRNREGQPCGSHALRDWIEEHQPKICVFGHIHEGASANQGVTLLGRTLCINASTCTRESKPTNKPIVVDVV
jgi:Icc-related predicted phosphoesterase